MNFKNEIPDKCAFFFEAPKAYDEQVVAKKWNATVAGFLAGFAEALPEMKDKNAAEIEAALKDMAQAKGVNPGSLMQPLRLCLSGEAGGPPLFEMLLLIGLNKSAERINSAVAAIAITTP